MEHLPWVDPNFPGRYSKDSLENAHYPLQRVPTVNHLAISGLTPDE